MTRKTLIEVCVDSVESALAAAAGGADRLELCQSLAEGGLTPSPGLLAVVRQRVNIPIATMIRPRSADFCYSDAEFEVMRQDLQTAKKGGADLIVLGLLNPDGSVDVARTKHLIELARPLPVTFHRAFDMVRDADSALEELVKLGVERVLTSGMERTVVEGLDMIVTLMKQARGRITIVPGGGISERNLSEILAATGAKEFHVSASATQESAMSFRNPRVAMGRTSGSPEYSFTRASEARVRSFRELAG
jgi:copper homeostasis protein